MCITTLEPELGWTLARGAVGRHRQRQLGFDVTYHIDKRGTRATGDVRPNVAMLPRLVLLGDSNGFGWGVDDERHLAASLVQDEVANVLNLSVSGYGTDQALLRLLAEGLAFRPHIVVLQVTPNDFDDIDSTMIAGRPKPRFVLEAGALRLVNSPVGLMSADEPRLPGGPWVPVSLRFWAARHSYLYAWLLERTASGSNASSAQRSWMDRASLFRELVERIRYQAATVGAELVVIHAWGELAERRVEAIPSGVHVIDLSRIFAAAEPALFADGIHWNERGHQLAAESIKKWIEAEGARWPRPGAVR